MYEFLEEDYFRTNIEQVLSGIIFNSVSSNVLQFKLKNSSPVEEKQFFGGL